MSHDKDKGKAASSPKPPSDQPTRPESAKGAGTEPEARGWEAHAETAIASLEHTDAPLAPPAKAPPKRKASQPGHTFCRVTGTAVKYHGRIVPEGTEDEFEDSIVLSMPEVFVSLE